MSYIEGIVGWKCPVCGSRNPSRRVICPCGESHRPLEEWMRREHELELALRETRFWLVFAVAAFVAAAGIAAAAWIVAFRDVKATTDFHSSSLMGSDFSYPVGRVAAAAVPGADGFMHSPSAYGQEEAGEVSACAAPAGVENLFSSDSVRLRSETTPGRPTTGGGAA